MSNFRVITNLRTTESGEDDLSFEWMKEEPFLPSSAGSPLSDISLDQLERFSFAKKIAGAIQKRKNDGSVIMGISGIPGEGKTTVLNFLGHELAKFQNLTPLRFNPSKATSSKRLIKSFFERLSETIEYSDDVPSSMRKKITRLLEGYSSFLAPVESELSGGKKLKLFKKSPAEIKESLDTCFRKLGKKIVFLVDDLDKTELNEVRTFIRLIKLSANFPNSVFVLSFDEPTLAMQLGGGGNKENLAKGRRILEKVLHLSLKIPPAGKFRLLEMCYNGIYRILSDLNIDTETVRMKKFKEKFSEAFSYVLKTPRQCNLYLNTISSSLPAYGVGLDNLDFMIVEAIRVFYPVLYEVIRNNPDTFIGVELNKSRRGEVEESISLFTVNKALDNMPDEEQKAVKVLMAGLFPCLKGIPGFGANDYFPQNPWIEEMPVASKQYFSRYFLLNTSGTDDLQREIDKLLLRSTTANINDLALSVRKLVRQAGMDAFITGVENRISEVSAVASGNMIRALAQTGGSFLNPESLFSFETVYSHPAVLIRKLLLNIPGLNDRFSIAAFLMKESEPVSFAFECLRWMRPYEKEVEIFSSEILEELSQILTERIKSLAYRHPVYLSMPEETPLLLSVWSFLGSREETTRYLESTFHKEPENVVEFIKCYMPDEWIESRDNELTGSFLLNLNSSVSGVIDSKVVYKQLEKTDAAIAGPDSKANSLCHRLLKELAPISGENGAGKRGNQLKVFNIHEYDKTKKIPEAATSTAEEIKRGNLAQVSKGLYRPLFDLFN
ncbi:MAG: P-loop NTPase fold protein [Acidobacteriota bacterium]